MTLIPLRAMVKKDLQLFFADRRAVSAFHIIGENFEFGLGVRRRAAVEQHGFDRLLGVGLLGTARDLDLAEIGTDSLAVQDAADGLAGAPADADMLDRGDDLVGREAHADIGAVELEIRAFAEADIELQAAIGRCGVEHEQPGFRVRLERDLDAADKHILVACQPLLFECLAWSNGQSQRLGELLPNWPQRIEVSVAPLLLLAGGERRGHAAASA